MTPRRKRLLFVAAGVFAVALAATFVLNAFKSNMMFFFSPSDVAAGKPPPDRAFRLGGMVVKGSVKRGGDNGLRVDFVVTDFAKNVPVKYEGILPDLFTEGQGVVAQGKLGPDGTFVATEVLAKHDEKYMPPEVADALKRAGKAPDGTMPPDGMPAPPGGT